MKRLQTNPFIFRFIVWFFLLNAILFWFLGAGYLSAIFSSSTLFKTSLADFSNPVGKGFVVAFALLNYLSYLVFLAFVPAAFVCLLAYFMPNRHLVWTLSVLLAAMSAMLILVDTLVFSLYKFHLNGTILSFLLHKHGLAFFGVTESEQLFLILTVVFIVLSEISIAWLVWKKIVLPGRLKVGSTIFTVWAGAMVLSYFSLMHTISIGGNVLAQQTPNLPLYNQIIVHLMPESDAENILYMASETHFTDPLFPNVKLNYPLKPLQCKKIENPPNIILIMVDSLRYDALQSRFMPYTTAFAEKNWYFTNYHSGGNATKPGIFSLFYSIPSNYWTAALEQKRTPVMMDKLQEHDYGMKILWSGVMDPPGFQNTVYRGVSGIQHDGAPFSEVGEQDRYTTNQAIAFLAAQKGDKPFFLNLFYSAPHDFCSYKSIPSLYHPALKKCNRLMTKPEEAELYHNRYLNTVTFVDKEIAKILAAIEKEGYLNNSVIIITSDHGQEFNDNKQNYWGHTSNFSSVQVKVPLIIKWPGEVPQKFNYVTSSYDIVPTLMQRLFACENPTTDYSVGVNLLQEKGRTPFLLAGSYAHMGIIEIDRLTTLQTSGQVTITTPDVKPIPDAKPRIKVFHEALALMRRYFAD